MKNFEDRELLERAAEAAGIKIKPMQVNNVTKQGDNQFIGYMTDIEQWPRGWFNPLTDDGDALRLAVMLEIDIFHSCISVRAIRRDKDMGATIRYKGARPQINDPYAATRRAIVRAAAEICKVQHANKR